MASSVDAPASGSKNNNNNTNRDTQDDLDPAAFLRSVRELSDRRDREDAERFRKLEKEVEASRAARAARRAERVRSISPEKTQFPVTPSSNTLHHSSANAHALTASPAFAVPETSRSSLMDTATPQSSTLDQEEIPDFKGFGSIKRTSTLSTSTTADILEKHNASSEPAQSATSLARSGTLSWQRRPTSMLLGRPKSVSPSTANEHAQTSSMSEQEPSRGQIAAALGARDPAWFKQTAERGIGSTAYRKSKDEVTSNPNSTVMHGRRGLPGMSTRAITEDETQSSFAQSEDQESETSRPSSTRDSTKNSIRFSGSTPASTPDKPDLKSLIAADEPQLQASPLSDRTSTASGGQHDLSRNLTTSSSQTRSHGLPERPSSPSKGMIGFVQSSMIKRSESVNKRWNAQQGSSGLSRQNSRLPPRGPFGALQGSHSMPKLGPPDNSGEVSNEPSSRPSSSSSNRASLANEVDGIETDSARPTIPYHNRSKSVASLYTTNADSNLTSPPASPGKRWRSPTKSSWIESALTQPESPKLTPARNSQPSWMADIARVKAQKAGVASVISSHGLKNNAEMRMQPSPLKSVGPFGVASTNRSDSREPMAVPPSSSPQVQLELTDVARGSTDIPLHSPHQSTSVAHNEPGTISQSSREDLNAAGDFSIAVSDDHENIESEEAVMPAIAATQALKSSTDIAATRVKPAAPPKPQTDFRSALRSRGPVEKKQDDTPEFLSKLTQLRRAQTEKHVAPDILKANITRGKSELTRTDGPVKTVRTDELKESLLARKEDIKRAKEEGRDLPGQAHDRKVSNPPISPSKPEALAKKEVLAKPVSTTTTGAIGRSDRDATPEAVSNLKALKPQARVGAPSVAAQAHFERLTKQTSAPAAVETTSNEATSKLAARFNPGLASILARGPPSASVSSGSSGSGSPAIVLGAFRTTDSSLEPAVDGPPLEDMRKGRAKGPKKSKGGAASKALSVPDVKPEPVSSSLAAHQIASSKSGSAALLMTQSPGGHAFDANEGTQREPLAISYADQSMKQGLLPKPLIPQADPSLAFPGLKVSLGKPLPSLFEVSSDTSTTPAKSPGVVHNLQKDLPIPNHNPKNFSRPSPSQAAAQTSVPVFHGFKSSPSAAFSHKSDEDKENIRRPVRPPGAAASPLTQLPSQASLNGMSAQLQQQSNKDEEALMRSADLLAKSAPTSPSRTGLGISVGKSNGQPPKPAKSSRVVSGQLQEASPNKGLVKQHDIEALRVLRYFVGSVPVTNDVMTIDTGAVMLESSFSEPTDLRTLNRSVQETSADNTICALRARTEYTLYEGHAYICVHTYTIGTSAKKTQIFIWIGRSAPQQMAEQTQVVAKKVSRESGGAPICVVQQGHESDVFLQAIGGILVTRRGQRNTATQQYLLCGRKHQGQLTFDEADLTTENLIPGFACLVSYPVTQRQTRFYIWKGAAASAEEVSAARLAAMDLSETGDIIEVDGGAEFASFLKTFGPGLRKSDLPQMTDIWRQKAAAPNHFAVRLYRIQQVEVKGGMLSLFGRRPSWSNSGSSSPTGDIKVEVKHINPFTQSDLEADSIYMLDACSKVIVLVGPLFASRPEHIRTALLTQAILFAAEYKALSLLVEQKPLLETKADDYVLLSGVTTELKSLFRYWDDVRGLWGTAGLMAGMQSSTRVKRVALYDVLDGMRRR